jgi:hypothetical protein
MFEVQKLTQKQTAVIRPVSGGELSEYEKNKIATIEEGAQKNKIESIKINDQRLQINPATKEVQINLGGLAFKSRVTEDELDSEELFFIRCELDDKELMEATNE